MKKMLLALPLIAVLGLSACTSDEPDAIDPTLLPPQPKVTSEAIDITDQPTDAVEPPSALDEQPTSTPMVEVGDLLDQKPVPESVPDGAIVYRMHDDKYLVVDPQDASSTDSIVEDTKQKVSQIPLDQAKNDGERAGLRGMWFETLTEEMLPSTGKTPVFIYSMQSAPSADSKETATVWGYWVMQGNQITTSPFVSSQQEAVKQAQEWIDDQGNANAFVVITEG